MSMSVPNEQCACLCSMRVWVCICARACTPARKGKLQSNIMKSKKAQQVVYNALTE